MVHFTNTLMFALMTAGARAVPLTLQKRIDQTTIDSVTPWETACDSAGGGAQCNTIAVSAASTLLAAAGNCDQQNAGDQMVTLAKSLNNNAQMISLAQIFVQQPRNSPTSQAVPYCDTAPQNEELNGFFQCQFQGVDESTFVGGLSPGAAGTAPLSGTVSPPGSCPANPSGPVADGVQLNTLVTSPGTPASGSGGASSSSGSGAAAASSSSSTASSSGDDAGAGSAAGSVSSAVASAAPAATSAAAASASSSSSSSGSSSFALSNGQEAQSLNAQFQTLSASSSCTSGQDACVNGEFAQCVNGAFATTSCGSGLTCAALPLVNKPGTSITCTTTADAEARIAATGATGGLTGSGSTASASSAAAPVSSPAATTAAEVASSTASSSSSSSFALSNGQEAQSLNAQFETLTVSSSCTSGQDACVNGEFAQCVNGAFATTSCGSGLTCAALPLVNKPGTSITCTTTADAEARIAATGATGGLTGSS